MPIDFDEVTFYGQLARVAEKCFGGRFVGQEGDVLKRSIYQEYVAAGTPKKKEAWMKDRLSSTFLSVTGLPEWVERQAMWPWKNGSPMVFMGQMSIPPTEIGAKHAVGNVTLFMFGQRIPNDDGWTMAYEVVTQYADLGGLGRGQ